ncbi:MAG TPA: glutamate--tRNA ligase family protein [Gaiellaceae bacterium]|nr:glutamate--tRNA ligase family protein [Gaiellaceae bacterium]
MPVVRVRFAPSPTGSLHLGSALTAAANRRFADERGGVLVLRIDDTDVEDPAGAEAAIVEDLDWLGIRFDEGPLRQSERSERHREAARAVGTEDAAGAVRFGRFTLVRPDGRPTYHLASVVDDLDLGITHVIRGKDHLANRPLHEALARALGAEPPEFVHHGLLVGEDGRKLSKRHGAASLAELREQGLPAEAVRAYLDELGLPRGEVRYDGARLRRLAVDAIAALPDAELARRLDVPPRLVAAARGARDLAEARRTAEAVLAAPSPRPTAAPETLERFRELRAGGEEELDERSARAIVRELKAVGGDLRALRLALTGRERGPELWTVLVALDREDALRRAEAALGLGRAERG